MGRGVVDWALSKHSMQEQFRLEQRTSNRLADVCMRAAWNIAELSCDFWAMRVTAAPKSARVDWRA